MVWEPIALQVFGSITAKTIPAVLDYLGSQLKKVLERKMGKGKDEVEALRIEVEKLRQYIESKASIGTEEIKQVETQIEKVHLTGLRYGLELISDNAHKRWIIEQFERLSELKSAFNDFKIDVWTQKGTLSTPRDINIVPKNAPESYRIGDKIIFLFHANQDCYLTLFDLGTSGSITILFPNRLFQDNFIRTGRTYTIPGEGYSFEYILGGPIGIEKIKAIASRDKVNLLDLDFFQKDRPFYSTERSSAAKDIQIVEKRMKNLPSTDWAIAEYEFNVR